MYLDQAKQFIIMLATAMLPVYIFSSGGIQPSHFLFFALSLIVIFTSIIKISPWVVLLFLFVWFGISVEIFYALYDSSAEMLIHAAFLLYSFLVSLSLYLFFLENDLRCFRLGLLIAGAVAVFSVIFAGVDMREMGEEGRAVGAFNNPNQLGYFSVCYLSLSYILYRHQVVSYAAVLVMFMAATFLAISSLSKAAMIAVFLVAFFAIRPYPNSQGSRGGQSDRGISRALFLLWLLVGSGLLSLVLIFFIQGRFDDYLFANRLQGMFAEDDSSLDARGYFAFLNGNTVQVLLGLGNAGVHRIIGHEVHSTIGGVFNNYGVLGGVIFFSVLVEWARKLFKVYGLSGLVCIAGPAMLYGLTHNGIRFTIFWVLFAVSLAMAEKSLKSQEMAEE